MSSIPGLDAHLAEVDIVGLVQADVALRLVVKNGRRSGPEWAGPCPFCGGKDRFRVWPEHECGRGRFWCRNDTADAHGCGASGDAVAYLRKRGLSWQQAMREIGFVYDPSYERPQRDAVAPPHSPPVGGRTVPDVVAPSELWQERAGVFVDWTHELLMGNRGEPVRDYLRERRGLKAETLRAFRVGANPYDAYEAVHLWGLETGKKVYLSMGLVLPGLNEDGQVWHVQVRRPYRKPSPSPSQREGGQFIGDALYDVWHRVPGWQPQVKYMSVRGGVQVMMFGLDKLRFERPLLVCEGELDAMLAWQEIGGGARTPLVDVVAFGGSKKVANGLPGRWLLRMLPYERVLVAYDGDAAGRAGARSLLAQCARAEPVALPDGMDVCDLWRSGLDLRGWIEEAL